MEQYEISADFFGACQKLVKQDVTGAREAFSELIAGAPAFAPALAYRSICHSMEQNYEEARVDGLLAWSDAPDMLEAKAALALAYHSLGRTEDSVEVFFTPNGDVHDSEGYFFHLLAFTLLAETFMGQSKTGSISHSPTPVNRAAAHILAGNPHEAVAELDDAKSKLGLLEMTIMGLAMYQREKFEPASQFFYSACLLSAEMFAEDPFQVTRSLLSIYACAGAHAGA